MFHSVAGDHGLGDDLNKLQGKNKMNFLRVFVTAIFIAGIMTACAGWVSDIVIELDPFQNMVREDINPCKQLPIEIMDIRKDIAMEKTSIGGGSLGEIDLNPPEPELVRDIIEHTLCKIFIDKGSPNEMPIVYCGIKTFDIYTPATPLYWDVIAKIELILRVYGQDHTVSGSAIERTWIWPSQDIIHRVANEALRQVTVESEQELTSIFSPFPQAPDAH